MSAFLRCTPTRAPSTAELAEEPRVLPSAQSLAERICLLEGHRAVLDRLVEAFPRMPEPDAGDRLVELLRVGGAADPLGLRFGDATGPEQRVDADKETIPIVAHARRIYGDTASLSNQTSP
jgi:hypothetical protein